MSQPLLVAIDGPLKGESIPLSASETTIGRDQSNVIRINEPSVSRSHCVIRQSAGGGFILSDSGSRNGTLVNGIPAQERVLQHGDEIKVGCCIFLFVCQEAGALKALSSATHQSQTVVSLRLEDSVYLKPAELLGQAAKSSRLFRAFQALTRIGSALHSARDTASLAANLLEILLNELFPANRAAILLTGSDSATVAYKHSRSADGGSFAIRDDLVEHAIREGVVALSTSGPTSILVAPLAGHTGTPGAIYLESTDPRIGFEEEHLQLLAALSVILAGAIESTRRLDALNAERQRLESELGISHDLVGESEAMQEIYRFIAKVAPSDSTVLIYGESGTGKELVARAIHRNSPRSNGPFVAINCAAVTETLLESELFGHEKGAFTGALTQKKGKFEIAAGGCLFLDEIGELPLLLQAKLLRALQEREFDRVGGTRPIRADVRVIAATNRDLRKAIAEGQFRQDLYYRLNVVSVSMPPLRERPTDIPLLATHFLQKHARRIGRRVTGFSESARICLEQYRWPGNVRELENAVERAIVMGCTDVILPEDLPEAVVESAEPEEEAPRAYLSGLRRSKEQMILEAIEESGGNITEAARLLRVHPNSLHRMIRNLGLKEAVRRVGADG